MPAHHTLNFKNMACPVTLQAWMGFGKPNLPRIPQATQVRQQISFENQRIGHLDHCHKPKEDSPIRHLNPFTYTSIPPYFFSTWIVGPLTVSFYQSAGHTSLPHWKPYARPTTESYLPQSKPVRRRPPGTASAPPTPRSAPSSTARTWRTGRCGDRPAPETPASCVHHSSDKRSGPQDRRSRGLSRREVKSCDGRVGCNAGDGTLQEHRVNGQQKHQR